jgi:hypothetical protein
MNKIISLFLIIVILGCTGESENLKNLQLLINAENRSDFTVIDSLLAYDFKFISDSISQNKKGFLDKNRKDTDTTWIVEIEEISEADNTIKTKEIMTNYGIRTLEIEPLIRERKYHFNDSNKIRLIYALNSIIQPEHEKLDKYFGIWASVYYPEMIEIIKEKREKGEDFFDERHFLLLQLKQKGLSTLDSARIIYENQHMKDQKKNKQLDNYNSLVPAPFYEYAFEKILATMMSIASSENIELPVNNPMLHKRLIEEAMWKNGYSYAKTLHKLAEYGFTPAEFQYVGILLAPVNKLETESLLSTIYSGQELIDVKKILRIMNNY